MVLKGFAGAEGALRYCLFLAAQRHSGEGLPTLIVLESWAVMVSKVRDISILTLFLDTKRHIIMLQSHLDTSAETPHIIGSKSNGTRPNDTTSLQQG